MKARTYKIQSGLKGIEYTLRKMMEFASTGAKHPYIFSLTRQIIKDVPEGDRMAELQAIFSWFKSNIRYTKDVHNVETLVTPIKLLQVLRQGDCDCGSCALASMLLSIGIPVRFAIIKLKEKGEWKHVYIEAKVKNKWHPLDFTNKINSFVGWEYGASENKRVYNVRPYNLAPIELDTELDNIWGTIEEWAGKIGGWAGTAEEIAHHAPTFEEDYEKYMKFVKARERFREWITSPMTWVLGGGGILLLVYVASKKRRRTK